ncbi:hypothetical protein E2C01_063945 [Portunus trituberculatus]|uniref:Uncharacterized protein n=1 Tax=Portunus trituberculatus TaxID=210409 RepID=A0A5B7HMF9_PORTR|nr:hypothetical protein [Portunus trituberculatus]
MKDATVSLHLPRRSWILPRISCRDNTWCPPGTEDTLHLLKNGTLPRISCCDNVLPFRMRGHAASLHLLRN